MMTSSTSVTAFHKVLNSSGTILEASLAFLLRPLFSDLALMNTKSGATELMTFERLANKGSFLNKMSFCVELEIRSERVSAESAETSLGSISWAGSLTVTEDSSSDKFLDTNDSMFTLLSAFQEDILTEGGAMTMFILGEGAGWVVTSLGTIWHSSFSTVLHFLSLTPLHTTLRTWGHCFWGC